MRKRGKLRRVKLVPANAVALLQAAGVVSRDQDPDTVMAWLTPSDNPARIIARFPDGWRADLRIRTDGSFRLIQSLNLKVTQ